jgi:hypothetical protein
MATPLQETFNAILNKQPPGPPSMRVHGDVEVNTGGWSGALVKAVPQGINPLVLILELKMTPPTGIVTQGFTKVSVEFHEKPAAHDYTDVTILDGKDSFPVQVQVVH